MKGFILKNNSTLVGQESAVSERLLIKSLVKQLELLHWKRKDIRAVQSSGQFEEISCIWSQIYGVISKDCGGGGREFIRRGGLNWVFWYVVEKQFVRPCSPLRNTFKELMAALSGVLGEEEKSDFKGKYFCCRDKIMEQLVD